MTNPTTNHILETINILQRNNKEEYIEVLNTISTLLIELTNRKTKAQYNRTFNIEHLEITIKYNKT